MALHKYHDVASVEPSNAIRGRNRKDKRRYNEHGQHTTDMERMVLPGNITSDSGIDGSCVRRGRSTFYAGSKTQSASFTECPKTPIRSKDGESYKSVRRTRQRVSEPGPKSKSDVHAAKPQTKTYDTLSDLSQTMRLTSALLNDNEIILDPLDLDLERCHNIPNIQEGSQSQRRDYSLPLDLDYDVLESQRELRYQASPCNNQRVNTRTFPPLFSHLRRGSGSLNDISSHESTRKNNMFDFGVDLDLAEQSEKMKNKFISVWNNMKYGWTIKTKTHFKYDSQIYLLGRLYHIKKEEEEPEYAITRNPLHLTAMERFKRDFTSRIWFTYRRDFTPLPMVNLTTDCGWGCMLRCGQMIIAQGLIDHFLGRDWRVYDYQLKEEIAYHRQIIRWFGDYNSDRCPFSLHSLILCGKFTGKKPGDWYGPSSVAHILRYALMHGYRNQPILKNIAIYVAQDCTVYLSDITTLVTQDLLSSGSFPGTPPSPSILHEWKRGVIILIPVRLGGEMLNPVYVPCIKALLAQDNCIGIIGGKPRHSMYFIGWQEDKLIYLDPHYCQDVVDVTQRDFRYESYHCMSPRKIAIAKIDPSCTIGFYCRTPHELNQFVQHTHEMMSGPQMRGLYPMFVISEGSSDDVPTEQLTCDVDRITRQYKSTVHLTTSTSESDDFVIL